LPCRHPCHGFPAIEYEKIKENNNLIYNVYVWYILCIYLHYVIYMVYVWYIPYIYHVKYLSGFQMYVLFTPSTYRVRTSQISMYSVRTEYRKHDKSTYFRLKVQLFVSHTSTYQYVLSTYFCAYSCTDFSSFRKSTYWVHADSGGVRTFGS
jgi:hypothetical protein